MTNSVVVFPCFVWHQENNTTQFVAPSNCRSLPSTSLQSSCDLDVGAWYRLQVADRLRLSHRHNQKKIWKIWYCCNFKLLLLDWINQSFTRWAVNGITSMIRYVYIYLIIYVHIYIYDSNYILYIYYHIHYFISYIDHIYILYIIYIYMNIGLIQIPRLHSWRTSGGDPIGLALLDQRPDAEPAPAPQLGHG